jgi:hypothetical protein
MAAKFTIIEPKCRQPRPADGIVKHSFRVGRYTVTMAMDIDATLPGVRGQTNVKWEPDVPAPGTLTRKEFEQYIRGRNAMQQHVANIIQGNILVADI